MLGIACLLLALLVAEKQQFGKLYYNLIKITAKMDNTIHLIQRQLMLMSFSDATLNLNNGGMVCCQLFLKIKINVNKNIKNLMFINGLF